MADERHRAEPVDNHAGLFRDLSDDRLVEKLAGFDHSAWDAPVQRAVATGRRLMHQEDLVVAPHDRADRESTNGD